MGGVPKIWSFLTGAPYAEDYIMLGSSFGDLIHGN